MHENMRTTLSRRSALKALGAIGAAAVLPGLAPSAAAQMAFTDEDIFNFALNLESHSRADDRARQVVRRSGQHECGACRSSTAHSRDFYSPGVRGEVF